MADLAGTLFTALTLGAIVTTDSLAINLTQNFGNLATSGQIKTSGSQLTGSFGNALTGMSAVVIGLGALYICFYIYGVYKLRGNKIALQQKIYWLIILLSVVIGISAASVDLYLTENYDNINSLATHPTQPIPGQNYSLVGSYGIATTTMASISLGFSGISVIWLVVMLIRNWNTMLKFDPSEVRVKTV